jgi:hypothetical protein
VVRAALTVGGYSALGATMGALFLGAAATLVRRPASQGGSLGGDSTLARPRLLLPALYRTRGLERPLLPLAHVLHHGVGDTADQVATDLDAVDLG